MKRASVFFLIAMLIVMAIVIARRADGKATFLAGYRARHVDRVSPTA